MNYQEALGTVNNNGMDLERLTAEFQDDQKIVFAAINAIAASSMFAREDLPCPLQFASDRLRDNFEAVSYALKNCGGLALMHASERLRDNGETVQIALALNPIALQYASTRLRAHKPTVVFAVSQRGSGKNGKFALIHASQDLQQDSEIIQAANLNSSD